MASQVQVSLLVCLLVVGYASSLGTFPMLGGFGNPFMLNPYMQNPYQNPNQNREQADPNLLTCINADMQDVQSQIRLTIRPVDDARGGMGALGPLGPLGPMGPLGLGGMGTLGNNPNRPRDWSVTGIMLPSQRVQKAGTYQIAVFEGGRTFGECKSSALGRVMSSTIRGPFGSMGMGVPPFSPLGLGLNPLSSMMGLQNRPQKPGMMSNPAMLGLGNTMYSGTLYGLSLNDLLGRSLGACQLIQNDQCLGNIPYCCTITRDMLPAEQIFVDDLAGGPANINGLNGVNGLNVPFGSQQGALVGAGALTGGLAPVGAGAPIGGASIVNIVDSDGNNGLF